MIKQRRRINNKNLKKNIYVATIYWHFFFLCRLTQNLNTMSFVRKFPENAPFAKELASAQFFETLQKVKDVVSSMPKCYILRDIRPISEECSDDSYPCYGHKGMELIFDNLYYNTVSLSSRDIPEYAYKAFKNETYPLVVLRQIEEENPVFIAGVMYHFYGVDSMHPHFRRYMDACASKLAAKKKI